MDTLEDSELMGDDLDSLLDCLPNEQDPNEVKSAIVPEAPANLLFF